MWLGFTAVAPIHYFTLLRSLLAGAAFGRAFLASPSGFIASAAAAMIKIVNKSASSLIFLLDARFTERR
ncbi:hypothetical protein TSAR_001911 [Trichomalopsis sarcophagae]|uniref:Uncharacterized protein n=1 Tax=Trichomalopsis sarcophagae TaxID=543379 RepID=A0A232F5A5_9HYME|nr:hypothetical protein TSAR_001911 [Trichomalopsis sarcophagae]